MSMVSVALLVVCTLPEKASPEPAPMAVYTRLTCGSFTSFSRACSASRSVCSSVAPGPRVSVTWVWSLSSAGMNADGSIDDSASDSTKNSTA